MIPIGVQVFVALEPIDLRSGFERLAGLAQERLGYDARGGALFVFVGRRGTAAKVLFFDGTGLCLFHKRLDRGTFRVPTAAPGATRTRAAPTSITRSRGGSGALVAGRGSSSRNVAEGARPSRLDHHRSVPAENG